jgi:hypothetical protein
MEKSLHDLLALTLSELGLPTPTNIMQRMLMKDRHFVGWKYVYDGGYGVLRAGGNVIEFYDEQGTSLKTVALRAEQEAA